MRITIFLSLVFLLVACSGSGPKSPATPVTEKEVQKSLPEESLKLVHLDVKGMHCEGCEKAIVASICKLDGIQQASASYTAAEAVVSFDTTRTSLEDICQAITDAGYSVDNH
jgi:copper chaperone CopZ